MAIVNYINYNVYMFYMKFKQIVKTCRICGKKFIKYRCKLCSEECKRIACKRSRNRFLTSDKGKLLHAKTHLRRQLKLKTTDELFYIYERLFLKVDVIESILQKRGVPREKS